jgi:transcriptional regulator with PAS, ATPase and Fis domain
MDRDNFQKSHGIIGESVEIKEIVDVILQVAPTDITVLITGESGTGKEIIAKAIHAASERASSPMVSVNAGAIPEGIIESELFGHEKGSFTGASETRKGYFEIADHGTIFLDEIGELPVNLQVKFLRVLENGEFLRVGTSRGRKVDVRVIAATNKDLEAEVRKGNFRADLFYRLRSVNIRIPPLRDRGEDIPLLFHEFAREISRKNNITFAGITGEAMDLLKSYHWPGNVRELRNAAESMIVIERGKLVDVSNIRKYLRDLHDHERTRNLPVFAHKTPEQAERELLYRALLEMKNDIMDIKGLLENRHPQVVQDVPAWVETQEEGEKPGAGERVIPLDEVEKRMIISALERYSGNRRLASRALNISERTLYRKIKEYGLDG